MLKLNFDQVNWVMSVLQEKNVIFMSVHGSHLYGLNRSSSDVDIKAIYIPSKEDLLMGRALKTYNKSNDELNIEIELKSISSFLNSAEKADTNCIDLLNTPDEFILRSTNVWEEIKAHCTDLYSKNMKGLIGYIKTHSHKYTNKINRYNEINELLRIVESFKSNGHETVYNVANSGEVKAANFKYIKNVQVVPEDSHKYLEVCGKKYIHTLNINSLIVALSEELERYGKRTKDGSKNSLDAKSLSHAIRVLSMLDEIIQDKKVTFPLKEKDYIFDVKMGNVEIDKIMCDIDYRYERCMLLLENSDLPIESNVSNMTKVVNKYVFGDSVVKTHLI